MGETTTLSIVDSKLQLWKSHLLDLSKRNRLLFFKQVKRGNVQIVEPGHSEIFAWLVQDGKKLTFSQHIVQSQNEDSAATEQETESRKLPVRPGEVRTNLNDQQLATTLYNIRQKARTATEEQGVNVLYLTFGMFEWYESENSDEKTRSPVILVPVELARSSVTKPYTLELLDEEILLNPTLARKMQIDLHLTFPAMPEEWEVVNLEGVFDQIRALIKGQPRWSVASEVYLGLFSFEKLVMLKDLEVHAQDVKSHPLVGVLAGDRTRLPAWSSDTFDLDDLDTKIAPLQTYQVLDADSSQQEAIALAKRGVSFVIQGPPGTGKSQTIVNVIAESLAQGKKVLFVSEKMAALEVVYKRLEECRLAEFCLEAHSHKANKSAIVAQLGKSLTAALSASQTSFEIELRQIADLREQLNRYAKALHKDRTTLHRTPFQIHGELAVLHKAPDLNFAIENITQVDNDQFGKMQAAIDGLAAMPEVWNNYDSHLWRGTLVQVFSFQNQTEIRFHFGQLIGCLSYLEVITTQFAEILGIQRPTKWAEVEPFFRTVALAVDTPFPPEHWLRRANLVELKKAAIEAKQVYTDYTTNLTKLLALHTEAILSLENLPELASRFEITYRNILRIFNSSYRRDLQIVQSTAISQRRIGYVQALTVLRLAVHVRETQQWIESHHAGHRQMLGKLFDGLNTRWDDVLAALDWTASLIARFAGNALPDRLVEILCNQPESVKAVKESISALQNSVEATRRELAYLGTVFPTEYMTFGGARIEQASLSLLKEGTQLRLDHLDNLGAWIDFRVAWKTAEQNGLGSFLQTAIAAKLKSDQLSSAFRKRFYELWLDAVYEQDTVLKDFRGDRQTKLIEQFRAADREQLSIAQKRIVAQLATQRPKSNWVEAPSSEVTILRREMEKKKRHKPIRILFAEIPNLLLALKPCLMMSPLSVSQFLSSSRFDFDVVIFDEASQICPEDAVSSIMRGRQVIVAGDRHQLPPTPFFKSLGIDLDFDESADDSSSELESLLQEWSVIMRSSMLKWHYRSHHESLIAFSNYNIYDNWLITFPNSRVIDDDLGVEFVYVPDGIYDRGKSRKNRVEAKRVAKLVFEHFSKSPKRSLGVVAFSEAQREAVDEELQCLVREQPEFEPYLNQKGPDAFFIKNLENVQGDERDVIFFSVGYGKDALGKMTMNFGPLNGEDGARRLNVAITRAKYHVKLVSSILPEDIDSAHPHGGVRLLRNYMEYARQGGRRETLYAARDATLGSEAESPFESSVYQALTERGLIVHKQIGCSGYRIDLAVVDPEYPGRYLLGIECDGATYHSAKTARDRDRLRQQILEEELGWKIHRVWSRDWIANPNVQVQRIVDAVSQLKQTPPHLIEPPAPSVPATTLSTNAHDDQSSTTEQRGIGDAFPKGVATYSYANLPMQGIPDQFYTNSAANIGQLLLQLVKEESPIHIKVACRRIAGCWGISRVGSNIENSIRYVAKRLTSTQSIKIREDFLWMPHQTVVTVRQPPLGESPRPIREIAIEEIAQAAYLCLQSAFSLTVEDLVVQTARLLGYDRTGEKVRKRIRLAVDRLVHENRAVVVNDKVELVSNALASGPTSIQGQKAE